MLQVGDVRATLKDARAERLLGAKWSLGHLVRETFGRTAVYRCVLPTTTLAGTASAADCRHCSPLRLLIVTPDRHYYYCRRLRR